MSDLRTRIYEFGPFRVDELRRILLRDEKPVRLSAKAFEILLVLLEEKGRLVEKDELMRRVWPDSVVEENNLTVNMSALRKALTESPGEHRYVVTVPGRGYQFVADVRQLGGEWAGENEWLTLGDPKTTHARSELAETESAPTPHVPGQADKPSTTEHLRTQINQHNYRLPILLTALLATTVVVSYLAYSRYPVEGSKTGITSIAVLPFANQTGDANTEYLSEGISESLINSLSQLPGVKVIARSSAFAYKGKEADINEVAKALGVEAILIGRVTKRGENLSINVELVNARDKTQMWGEQYDRKATDLLAAHSEVSREIADKLRLRLSAGEPRQLAKTSIVNPVAYEMLLRGRFYWNKGGADRRKAVDYYNQAIANDPNYAHAYAELAYAYSILGNDGDIDPKEAAHKADAAAVKALELDEGLAEAHQALAYNKQQAWDWEGAEREYKRAIELNPNYAEARASYSMFLSIMGRQEQAVTEAKRAKELDPFSIRINIWVFNTLFISRRYDEALGILKEMQELEPNHPLTKIYLTFVYVTMGRYPEAIAAYKEMIKVDNSTYARIYLGYAYAKAGRREEAEAILKALERSKQYVPPNDLAVLYAVLGENDQAFQLLERAYSAHDLQLQYIGVDPGLDSLRSDPRFHDLMRRVGLPE